MNFDQARKLRWVAASVFLFASVLNYLDRLMLATVAPRLYAEFHWTNTDYGLLLSAFSIAYALASPLAGYLLDRIGLNKGISLAVALWSLASIATGLVNGFAGLFFCRAALGVGESGGIPAVGKLDGAYLAPEERALGAALTQVGLTLGGVLAPPLATWITLRYSWRRPFLVTGLLGLLWILAWRWTARRIPPTFTEKPTDSLSPAAFLRDSRLLALAAANLLWMGIYTLWSNWTTLYLVQVQRLSLSQAAAYAWIPPVAATFGGFLGGWLSLRWIAKGYRPVPARLRAILASAAGCLVVLLLPFCSRPPAAIATISLSYFWATAGSVNLYTLPVDLYGGARAGFAVSLLVCSYGLLQTLISPVIGRLVDQYGYTPVCWMVALPPVAGYALLRVTLSNHRVPDTPQPSA